MRIFREGKYIRCQLQKKEGKRVTMLFDFLLHEDDYPEMREHMLKNLEAKPIDKL